MSTPAPLLSFPYTTVFTLEPLDLNMVGNYTSQQFSGSVCSGKTVLQVNYPAALGQWSINAGISALNSMFPTYVGTKVLVFGYSEGAQVVSQWLSQYAGQSGAPDPNYVQFLLIGNPERKYGGFPTIKAQHTTPNNTQYTITDFKIQYDTFADFPNLSTTLDADEDIAVFNAFASQFVHCFSYLSASLTNSGIKTYVENTTTYQMLPNTALPMLDSLSIDPSLQSSLQSEFGPMVEAQYSRPET